MPGSILQSQLGDIAAKCAELAEKLERMASADVQGLLADCDALVKSLRAMADRLPVTEGALHSDLNLVMGQLSDTLDGVKDLSADARAIRSALAGDPRFADPCGEALYGSKACADFVNEAKNIHARQIAEQFASEQGVRDQPK